MCSCHWMGLRTGLLGLKDDGLISHFMLPFSAHSMFGVNTSKGGGTTGKLQCMNIYCTGHISPGLISYAGMTESVGITLCTCSTDDWP